LILGGPEMAPQSEGPHDSHLSLASDGGAPITDSPRLRLRLALRPRDVLRLALPLRGVLL